jgi:flagellar hook-basal body complex protein FliE
LADTTAISGGKIGTNAFEDMLSKAIESLNEVSQTEVYANQLAENYARGQADLKDVMVAQAKASILMQLAVTTVNAAVNTFKEVTQMQV